MILNFKLKENETGNPIPSFEKNSRPAHALIIKIIKATIDVDVIGGVG